MQPGVKSGMHPMARHYQDSTQQHQEPSKLSNSKKFSNALVYLDHIKKELGESQPGLYQEFLRVMSEFKSQTCDTGGVVNRIKFIFKDHPDLIREFNDFLPPGLQIPEVEIEALKHKPIILNSARDYVQKIKARFIDDPATYKSFLQILHAYKTESLEPNAQINGISVVTHQIKVLFKDHQDLIDQFHQFVKNDTPAVQTPEYPRNQAIEPPMTRKYERKERVEPQVREKKTKRVKDDFRGRDRNDTYREKEREKPITNNNYRFDEDDDYRDTDSSFEEEFRREQDSKRTSVRQSLKRAAPVSRNHFRNNEQDEFEEEEEKVVRNHVNIDPADKELFTKIKTSLGVRWKDFLKVMNMLNQGVIEKKEMCVITYHMFGECDLFDKFRKLLNVSLEEFESVKNIEHSSGIDIKIEEEEDASESSSSPETEEEKVRMENSASYYYDDDGANTYSGRTQLDKEILNYNWVSQPPPTDEKDPTFYSSPKNIYEEKLFDCEDGRFELDVLIGRQNVVKGLLKNLMLDLDTGKIVSSVEQYLGVLSCLCLKTLYGYEGESAFSALCDFPRKVIPLIIDVLDRKGEELLVAKKVFDSQWAQIVNENYKKSQDQSINRPRESALREKGKSKEKDKDEINIKVEDNNNHMEYEI
jgi:paired amphipathic helix protein Sin3a